MSKAQDRPCPPEETREVLLQRAIFGKGFGMRVFFARGFWHAGCASFERLNSQD